MIEVVMSDMTDIDALISEARSKHAPCAHPGSTLCHRCNGSPEWPCLTRRLADALRSAHTDLLAAIDTARERGEQIKTVLDQGRQHD